MNPTEQAAGAALRYLAKTPQYRRAFETDPLLRSTLWPAASRYILAEDRAGLLDRLPVLEGLGYRPAVELVGEEAGTPIEVEAVVSEYIALLSECRTVLGQPVQLGFDLSNVGSMLSWELARDNTERILAAAAGTGSRVILSMEDDSRLPRILDVFESLADRHPHLGITPCRRTCIALPATYRGSPAPDGRSGWSRASTPNPPRWRCPAEPP